MLYVQDAINRIEQFKQELINTMPAISTEVTGLFVTAKINQLRKVGIANYSPKLYSAHRLKGKELNSAGRTFLDNKIKKKEPTNWAQLRNAQGLQTRFVDLYYSGQMLNSVGIERNNTVSFRYYSIVGARNDEARKKMFYNQLRYKNFLYPTPEQQKLIGQGAISRIAQIYKRILLT